MSFLGDLFSGIEDVARGDLGMFDDLVRMDFSGAEDRMDSNLMNIMENDSLRTVGLPVADFFSYGLASQAAKAKYNKLKYGQSGFEFGDLAKSVGANYLGNEIFPASRATGLEGIGYNVGAGAGRGALSAGIQGNSMTEGAKSGALGGGVIAAGDYLGSLFRGQPTGYKATDPRQGLYNEITQTSSAPQQQRASYFSPDDTTAPQQSKTSYVDASSPLAYDSTKTTSPDATSTGLGQQFSDFISGLMPNNATRGGDVVQGLAGLYSGYRRRRAGKEMAAAAGANRGSYEKQLRLNLERRDAAAGRRSNYAGREVELQSALAQLDSRNAPMLQAANEARYSGLDSMMRSGLQMGGNLGWFGPNYQRPAPFKSIPSVQPLRLMPEMPIANIPTLNELAPTPRKWEY